MFQVDSITGYIQALFRTKVLGQKWLTQDEFQKLQFLGEAIADLMRGLEKVEQDPDFKKLGEFIRQKGIEFEGYGHSERRHAWQDAGLRAMNIKPVKIHDDVMMFGEKDFELLEQLPEITVDIMTWLYRFGADMIVYFNEYIEAGHEYKGIDAQDELDLLEFRYDQVASEIQSVQNELDDLSHRK